MRRLTDLQVWLDCQSMSFMRSMWVLLAGAWLISCGGGGSGKPAAGGSGGPADGGGSGGTGGPAADGGTGPLSGVSLRFVNTFLPSGTTGPTVDVYDTYTDSSGDVGTSPSPIVTGLAYGAVSDYVTPHLTAPGSTTILLWAVPGGSSSNDPGGTYVWPGTDDGSHQQVTVLLEYLGPAGTGGPLDGLGSSSFVEKGDDGFGTKGPLAPASPTGQAEFLASTAPIDVTPTAPVASYYFFVDDACTPPLNGDPNQPGVPYLFALSTAAPSSFFALYPASSGPHQLSVVAWTDGVLPTCAQLTARQGTTSVTVAAGEQIIAFVYGSSLGDLHLVTAPIRP